jgi:hypothetical protein
VEINSLKIYFLNRVLVCVAKLKERERERERERIRCDFKMKNKYKGLEGFKKKRL